MCLLTHVLEREMSVKKVKYSVLKIKNVFKEYFYMFQFSFRIGILRSTPSSPCPF